MKVIFGQTSQELDLKDSEKFIHGTSGFISGFMSGNYPEGLNDLIEEQSKHFNRAIKDHLVKEEIIPAPEVDKVLTDEQNRERVQGFLFVNPGSATLPNYRQVLGTVAILTISPGKAEADIIQL